jgi:hypothetical protein
MSFFGMRGTGDWATDERPKDWRSAIMYYYPNGDAPLTALLAFLRSERTTDPEFNWWTKAFENRVATLTGVYTDAALGSAYVSGGVADDVLYCKMSAEHVAHFRAGQVVMFRVPEYPDADVNGKVIARQENGASSYVAVRLLEDDDNHATKDLSDATKLIVVGNANAEGAAIPDSLLYNPVKWRNYTQIFRTPLDITRTALRTRLRTRKSRAEAKKEALQYHSADMEMAYLFGIPTEKVGENGKPERTTLGLVNAIRGRYTVGGTSGTYDNYTENTDYSSDDWLTSGETWLEEQLEIMFRYGSGQKLALCGTQALMGLNALAKNGADMQIKPGARVYGMDLNEWITPVGTIMLKTHPLFNLEASLRRGMVIFEPENLRERYIDQTVFIGGQDANAQVYGHNRYDGIKDEYLTEAGLEYHHPIGWGYLEGIGSDNVIGD